MALGLAILLLAQPAVAHEGHDHGSAQPAAATPTGPRAAARSEAYELLGILRAGRLIIYLDRFGTNEPVIDVKLVVTVGGDQEVTAEPRTDGTYAVLSPKFAGSGPLELVFAVNGPSGDDLLIGTIQLPERPAAPASTVSAGERSVRVAGAEVPLAYLMTGVALALGFLVGLAVRSGRKLVPITALALIAILVSTALALSHESEDHGQAASTTASPAGDAPQRLTDGSVFVPKPSQRILEVRTAVTMAQQADRTTTLIGRVIADPNRSGLVQSINGGRVSAPEGGSLPQLGKTVRKGDVLGMVEMPMIQADRATLAEKVGDIEQQTTLAEARLARARRLLTSGAGTAIAVSDAELEVDGLRRRRETVREIRSAPEVLRAPIEGVIASSRVVAGQVVQAQDILFQLVDPRSLWVEAIVFHDSDMPGVAGASASTTDGGRLKLTFQGASRALQQQATLVQFSVVDPPPSLNVGQPLTVVAPSGKPETGIILPREAVVRGQNGETLVWRHTDPERFEPRLVRTEAFDATRLVVRSGLTDGERVVVRGAELINQIR